MFGQYTAALERLVRPRVWRVHRQELQHEGAVQFAQAGKAEADRVPDDDQYRPVYEGRRARVGAFAVEHERGPARAPSQDPPDRDNADFRLGHVDG